MDDFESDGMRPVFSRPSIFFYSWLARQKVISYHLVFLVPSFGGLKEDANVILHVVFFAKIGRLLDLTLSFHFLCI